jgi:hypothetical protein
MTNPLLAKIKLPGRIFQLPSKGKFYEEGVLAEHVRDGEVEVRPLSAFAEMKLRSPDLLFSGRAVREVCIECIPDILKPEKLISKDVDAIFCFLRVVTYGSTMEIRSIHDCPHRVVNNYAVNIEDILMQPNNSILDHIDVLYQATLSNGQKVILKPVTFQASIDTAHLQQEVEQKLMDGITDQELIERTMILDTKSIIASVDGIADSAMIDEWLRALPKKYFNEIIDQAKQASEWGFNLDVELTCKDCGEKYKHSLQLDPVNFFSG